MTAAILAFLASLVPLQDHAWKEPPAVTLRTYAELAGAIADVAMDPREEPLPGLSRERTALVLANIAARESVLRADVVYCRKHGLGKAWGPYQMEHPRHRFLACASLHSATRLALAWARESFRTCASHALPDRLALYTDGQCGRDHARSRARIVPALRWPLTGGSIMAKRRGETRKHLPWLIEKDRGELEEELAQSGVYPVGPHKPRTRGECDDVPRPCPFVTCKFNNTLETTPQGGITYLWGGPDAEVPAHASCVLDIAERGELSLHGCAPLLNVTSERVRQVEEKAFASPHMVALRRRLA